MSIRNYQLAFNEAELRKRVAQAIVDQEPVSIEAVPVLDQLAAWRGESDDEVQFKLCLSQILPGKTLSVMGYVGSFGWATIVAHEHEDNITFEVITND